MKDHLIIISHIIVFILLNSQLIPIVSLCYDHGNGSVEPMGWFYVAIINIIIYLGGFILIKNLDNKKGAK